MFKGKSGYYYYELERKKERSLKTKDKREATVLYNIIKREYLKGRLVQLDQDTHTALSEFKTIFFSTHNNIRDNTVDSYEQAFKLLADSIGGSTLIARIGRSYIDKFKSDCLARGCKKTTINAYLRLIRSFLNKAHEWGHIKVRVKIDLYKIGKRNPRILTKDEIKKILVWAKKEDPEMHRVILFALWTGARRKEIANFKWQDVIKDDMCRLIGKGDKERVIPLLPKALEAMGPRKDIGYVFIHFNNLDTYGRRFKSIVRHFGIEDAHLHNLRHTAATQMLESGIEITFVRDMLGHAALATTEIYVKIVQKKLAEEMKKLKY